MVKVVEGTGRRNYISPILGILQLLLIHSGTLTLKVLLPVWTDILSTFKIRLITALGLNQLTLNHPWVLLL